MKRIYLRLVFGARDIGRLIKRIYLRLVFTWQIIQSYNKTKIIHLHQYVNLFRHIISKIWKQLGASAYSSFLNRRSFIFYGNTTGLHLLPPCCTTTMNYYCLQETLLSSLILDLPQMRGDHINPIPDKISLASNLNKLSYYTTYDQLVLCWVSQNLTWYQSRRSKTRNLKGQLAQRHTAKRSTCRLKSEATREGAC